MENEPVGTSYIFYLQEEQQQAVHDALVRQTLLSVDANSKRGEPMPYTLSSDWVVTSLLLLCFILTSYVMARGKQHIKEEFKNFFSIKERTNLFDETTASDMRHKLALIFQTCMLEAFCLFDYFIKQGSNILNEIPHSVLLISLNVITVLFYVLKWVLYLSVNTILFNKTKSDIWLKSYFNVIIWIGFLLAPVVLLTVFFDLSATFSYYIILTILIFGKFLLIYKCIHIFFNNSYGAFHFILYFCAVEILPSLLLLKGLLLINSYWF